MNKRVLMFMALVLGMPTLRSIAKLSEPGPEAAGLRFRLVVRPHPEGGKEGYDVQVALMNVSRQAILLQAKEWRSPGHQGGFQEFLEAAVSIESDPPIEPPYVQVLSGSKRRPEPEYALKPAAILSLKWHTTGRHLKNRVSNPLYVYNPEFAEDGLHSIHASVVVLANGRSVRLRSNEQLVAFGGSREAPKHTYGSLCSVDEMNKTAGLDLGSMDKIVSGDRFLIHSRLKSMTWTLTITQVEADYSTGTVQPSQGNEATEFPSRGMPAGLIPRK